MLRIDQWNVRAAGQTVPGAARKKEYVAGTKAHWLSRWSEQRRLALEHHVYSCPGRWGVPPPPGRVSLDEEGPGISSGHGSDYLAEDIHF
jgi:hypothetical protein